MMGDAAKPCFARRNKERGILNEEDFQKCALRHDYQAMDDYGNGHGIGIEKRKGALGHYGTSPRKGAHGVTNHPNSSKNTVHNQGMRINEASKDQIKKWVSDNHHANLDSWREYRSTPRVPVVNRTRKDSSHECESQGNRNGRKQSQRDLTSDDLSDRKGNSETKKHRKPRRSRRIRKEENDQEEDMDGPVIDESLLTAKELLGLQQAEERLKRDFIYRLRKRPRSYPTAKYTCKLCDTLIESVAFAHKHIKEKRHKKNIKEKQEQQLLTALPPPTPLQIEAIGVAIEKVVQEFGLNNEDLEQRLGVKTTMESVLHQKLPDCSLRLYGSSCSRFGFKNSDVNLDIQFPANMSQPDVLLLVQESLKNSGKAHSFISRLSHVLTSPTSGENVISVQVAPNQYLLSVGSGQDCLYLMIGPIGPIFIQQLRGESISTVVEDGTR